MPGQMQDDVIVFRKVFVMYDKNSDLSESELNRLFQDYGNVEHVHIAKDQNTGMPKGVAYITFSKTSEACLAAEAMNNQNIDGQQKRLKVHIAHDRRDNLEIDVELDKMLQRLFVNHPKNASQEEVKEFFKHYGEVIWMYQLKDKHTGSPRGSAFIKYELQSQAAIALEACNATPENNYRARWADVRRADPAAPPQRHGLSMEMSGGGARQMDRGMGGGGRGDAEPDLMSYSSARGGLAPPMGLGPRVIEALVPKVMTQNQIYRIFDIAPGLQDIDQDNMTGMVTCQYATPADAAYAKEKIDGMDMYGQVIAVRFAKNPQKQQSFRNNPTSQLRDTLRSLQQGGGAGNVHALVQSLTQVTEAITHGASAGGGGDIFDYEPVSSVRLPPIKQMLPEDTPPAIKVFINRGIGQMSEDVLVNVCCRFGNLISVRWINGKSFGFAAYAQKSSAQAAVNTLNGAVIDETSLKVEIAKVKDSDGDGPNPQKRARQF